MISLIVNGKQVECPDGIGLMEYLREQLRLTSVKDGCSEGACGTCTILVDGKARRACTLKPEKLEGKSILTLEGLSGREKDVFGHAFAACGAVQCGFCIPGMVMCGKGLLDTNPDPSPAQVKEAIKANICRCTGYKKIEQAIMLAAKMLREHAPIPDDAGGEFGSGFPRVDARAKALGKAEYTDDIQLDGMIYGGAVRSAYPRAVVKSIDLSQARLHPEFVIAATAEDIPGERIIGHLKKDWPVLIAAGETTRYVGDAIVLLAAQTKKGLQQIKQLVKIEYQPLQPVRSPAEAMAEGAPDLHEGGNIMSRQQLIRGDADQRIRQSKYVVTQHYSTPFTEHAFLEPECAVALPEDGGIHIYSSDQGIYQTQRECSDMLKLSVDSVRVTAKKVGGGFGGKEDMSVQHHAALLAYLAQRPVKVKLSRAESLAVHPKRHAMEMDFTSACDENGRLTALKARIVSDTGAYASLGRPVLQRACTHAAGPYNYQDVDIVGMAVYTNNPPGGAFRGFGVTQSCFATESNLNRLAEMVGISPYEIRRINALKPGDVMPNGQIADDSTAIINTLEAVRDIYESAEHAGIACAMKNSGLGVGIKDIGRCRLLIKDGIIRIYSSAACLGQGLGTILLQIVNRATGIDQKHISYEDPDTALAPDSGNTTASRQTLFTGEATRRAAMQLAADLQRHSLTALEGKEYYGEYLGETDPMGSDKPHPISHVAYSYATHVVILDDDGKIGRVVACHDVGAAVNPINIQGQVEGGIVMSLGYALTEEYPLQDCVPKAKFGTLGLFKSTQTPDIETIIVGKDTGGPAYGAKGIGEICSIPTAPAVAAAYKSYDGKTRNSLPLTETPYTRKP